MGGNHHLESKLVVKFGAICWGGTIEVSGFGSVWVESESCKSWCGKGFRTLV